MRRVALIFRKPRITGNFSIETSFASTARELSGSAEFDVRPFVSTHFSNGLWPRVRGVLEARRIDADIYHVTGDVHYFCYGLPRDRTVLTVHDCGFMHQGSAIRRAILRQFWLQGPVRHCRHITAVSEATRQDVIAYSGCDPGMVTVIPTVIGDQYRPAAGNFDASRPRILHIGIAPNKNFDRHVAALAGLTCHLHVVGRLSDSHRALLARHRISYSDEWNVSDSRMREIHEAADILLFASTLEGFGMPIVEAQSVGRAVVTSNISSMPEVSGSAACLVDPYDVDSIRDGVRRVIEDAAYRESLIEAGFDNAKRFSAREVAARYADLYRTL